MKYVSTRGGMPPQSFTEVLLAGLAPDGGLVICESYPKVSEQELKAWRGLPYAELAFQIISKFADDIPADVLKQIIAKSYTAEIFCNGEHTDEITPLKTLAPGLHILALSNGPTLAFKDIAMQLLGNLFEYTLAKNHAELNILGATSGDTGSSAEYAMRGKRGMRVFMLSPKDKMSAFQTAQMFSLQDKNIFNVAVDGVFDDCQGMVKTVSLDAEFKAKYKIGTVNSINWARVAAQVVYYFKGYFAATKNNNEQVSFAVPSGNFGNICAGHIARMMNLPIRKLILATNENNVLDEFFRTGIYRTRTAAETRQTSSPSMDISKASNFERFVFDLMGRDAKTVRGLWHSVDTQGSFDLSGSEFFKRIADYGFVSGSSSHLDRIAIIRGVKEKYGVVIDPHTADGIKVGMGHREKNIPLICLETALPAKFAETIQEALGIEPARPEAFKNIEKLPRKFDAMAADAEQIKQYIIAHI
ncbi:MAG: threonine synthase [Burkholderiales bacterium]